MAHLQLLFSYSRRHPQHHRLLSLYHFSSDANSSSAPPPPIKPVSYAPKPQQQAPPEESAASLTPDSGSRDQSPLPRRPQPPMPPPEWTRQDMRYVKDAPVISPVSYPSRVAPLPEDRPVCGEAEAVQHEGLRGEAERIQMDAARATRSIFGMPLEEEQLPYPTIIPIVKRPQKVAIDLVDAIRLVKVCCDFDLSPQK